MLEAVSSLPDDVDSLRQIIAGLTGELAAAKAGLVTKSLEIETLKVQIARLRRQQFGRSSEKLDRQIEQLELVLEDLEVSAGADRPASEASAEIPATEPGQRRHGGRRPLPAHLPRREVVHAGTCACPACGGVLRQVGEDVTEILDYVPGRFEVVRHVRPALSCRTCETMVQAPMPSLPIERGQPGPGLLAHVLVCKFCDHLPLYRQSGIYARDGVELDRATLADWVGKMAALLKPLAGAVERHILAADKLHADDTPVPVLAPGTGKTKTGRLWVYLRDERPHGGSEPPAVFYRYSADRKGEHPRRHLAQFSGFLQADGYAGFGPLYEDRDGIPATVSEVACWAHVRRKFHDIHLATASPLAAQALERIGGLFEIERQVNGQSPEVRKQARHDHAQSQLDDLAVFLDAALAKISGKSELAAAIRYARSRWVALIRYLDDGRLEMTNNAAERAIRPLTLGRKNWLFAGSDAGGDRAAVLYTLIETAKLNGRDPEAYLRDVIGRIADHPINRIADLLPWNIAAPASIPAAA
ncbi:IS66 family transposase [Magnetospirillum sp. SS-4]|uniref:IS66 family transposase n=1 Tax=Magnetospirillum sp. SS-4 TaxID=2681465 RepID=UPI001572BCF0|nr:IS66 family transposase [Magnetospirillum sp. SS-4]